MGTYRVTVITTRQVYTRLLQAELCKNLSAHLLRGGQVLPEGDLQLKEKTLMREFT